MYCPHNRSGSVPHFLYCGFFVTLSIIFKFHHHEQYDYDSLSARQLRFELTSIFGWPYSLCISLLGLYLPNLPLLPEVWEENWEDNSKLRCYTCTCYALKMCDSIRLFVGWPHRYICIYGRHLVSKTNGTIKLSFGRPMTVFKVASSFDNVINVITGVVVTWNLWDGPHFLQWFCICEFDIVLCLPRRLLVLHLFCVMEVMLYIPFVNLFIIFCFRRAG